MEAGMKRSLTMRKWMGDDAYSWAVFQVGAATPIVSGCSRSEARSHMQTITALYKERGWL
jgi:hypothetical protein